MSRKLFFQKSANVEKTDYCFESLLPDIPFYGMKGTICRIEVLKDVDDNRELCYYKVLYNHDGTINPEKIRVSKKYLFSLLNDYYDDLKKYLDLNNGKYLDYKTSRMTKMINKKIVQVGFWTSMILVIAAIPVLISTAYIGAIIEAIFILSLYITNDMKKKIVEDERKQKFIRQYDDYQKNLVNHCMVRANNESKVKKTAYTEISSKTQSLEKNFPKVKSKILVKEELMEAA